MYIHLLVRFGRLVFVLHVLLIGALKPKPPFPIFFFPSASREGHLMEGVGARLGRSSTRYGPATVFSGPVRKWKKKWVPLSNPNSNASSNAALNGGGATNNNHSHRLLYKWTPISSQANGSAVAAPTTQPRQVT